MNSYRYTKNNPINNTDIFGLLAGDGHSIATIDAFNAVDPLPGIDINEVARLSQDADYLPESQEPANAAWHCMRRDGLTEWQGKRNYEMFINKMIKTCNKRGLARALHAAEDCAASGHQRFAIWKGGIPNIHHVFRDLVPTDNQWTRAVNNAKKILDRYKRECITCGK